MSVLKSSLTVIKRQHNDKVCTQGKKKKKKVLKSLRRNTGLFLLNISVTYKLSHDGYRKQFNLNQSFLNLQKLNCAL